MLILAVHGLAVNGALPHYIVSKSVLHPLYSVKKCLTDSLSVLFEVSRPESSDAHVIRCDSVIDQDRGSSDTPPV